MAAEPENVRPLGPSPSATQQPPPPAPKPAARAGGAALDGFPDWARKIADVFYSQSSCVYLLHGNVRDLFRSPSPKDDETAYIRISDFLATQLFGNFDLALQYDMAQGLRIPSFVREYGGEEKWREMLANLHALTGKDPGSLPRDPDGALGELDRMVYMMISAPDGRHVSDVRPAATGAKSAGGGIKPGAVADGPVARKKDLVVILDYGQFLAPEGDVGSMARGQSTNLVRLLNWAQNPYVLPRNIEFCIIADRLGEVNNRLSQNPRISVIEVPLPDAAQRKDFIEWTARRMGKKLADLTDYKAEELAELTNGLTLLNIEMLLTQCNQTGKKVDADKFRELKKDMIEQQCQGMLEFITPKHTLDMVVGMEAAKKRLVEDAKLLAAGKLDYVPMGYLLCGPVGTGKTFMAECYAGSVGIPCVTLRNFRSKYVGETEGNLEMVLRVLRSLGPVVVIIDEADAALGTREAEGDSGTSSRVFAMIARQMGDTNYRGKIVWMLLTSRPDLLPIDLKRQGRCEVHIPLFYPYGDDEARAMTRAMAKKNKIKVAEDAPNAVTAERKLSGADIESVLVGARRKAMIEGRDELQWRDLEDAFNNFMPSAQGIEKEIQELCAVLECTDLQFLPLQWRDKVSTPNGRIPLQERVVALRQLLERR